jgi:hypothetical protein|uniref:Uncharacterized protein n=1 Tax=Zea mays TaxID=4577 RepID=C0PFY5_MAIZE|nr:unknown [Zea mays]
MPTEHLKCVNLKIFKLADWLDKVSILCFEVVEKDGSNHLDDNTTEEELEAAREIELERLPTPETLKNLEDFCEEWGMQYDNDQSRGIN